MKLGKLLSYIRLHNYSQLVVYRPLPIAIVMFAKEITISLPAKVNKHEHSEFRKVKNTN